LIKPTRLFRSPEVNALATCALCYKAELFNFCFAGLDPNRMRILVVLGL
jgi:hypothetical protein